MLRLRPAQRPRPPQRRRRPRFSRGPDRHRRHIGTFLESIAGTDALGATLDVVSVILERVTGPKVACGICVSNLDRQVLKLREGVEQPLDRGLVTVGRSKRPELSNLLTDDLGRLLLERAESLIIRGRRRQVDVPIDLVDQTLYRASRLQIASDCAMKSSFDGSSP